MCPVPKKARIECKCGNTEQIHNICITAVINVRDSHKCHGSKEKDKGKKEKLIKKRKEKSQGINNTLNGYILFSSHNY